MRSLRSISTPGLTLGLALLAGVSTASAAVPQTGSSQSQQTDNTAHNKSHNASGTVADTQSNAKSDVQVTAGIRKAILADKGLSTYAHNVKIITKGGAVTLKGPVKSDDEKTRVAAAAASVVSSDKITNQLTVKQ